MALYPDYTDLAALKAHLRIDSLDTLDDTALSLAITAASRAVDHACNRQFGLSGSAVPLLVDTESPVQINCRYAFPIMDLMTTTGLEVKYSSYDGGAYDQSPVLDTDYYLWPRNAPTAGRPWTHIVVGPLATFWPGHYEAGMKVTAKYGWTTVPDVVEQATLIQAARFFMRRDSPYGVSGSPDTGSEVRLLERLDPDVAQLLKVVARPWGAV